MFKEKIVVTFLDVGQGDSTVLILPDNSSAIVIDCPTKQETLDYLEHKRINNVYLFLTHTDLDHMGGIAQLAQNFEQVNILAYNHDTFLIAKDRSKRQLILKQLARLIERRGILTDSPRTGNRWLFQGVEIEALHPNDSNLKITVPRGDTNNASIVLKVTFASKRVLLTADLQGAGWQWIIERNTDLKADILKFPHHGAWYEPIGQQPSLEKILERIDPNLVILSVGTRNTYNHPRSETFKYLQKRSELRFLCTEATDQCYSVLKTALNRAFPCAGTIEVIIEEKGIIVAPDPNRHAKIIQPFDNAQCK